MLLLLLFEGKSRRRALNKAKNSKKYALSNNKGQGHVYGQFLYLECFPKFLSSFLGFVKFFREKNHQLSSKVSCVYACIQKYLGIHHSTVESFIYKRPSCSIGSAYH